MNESPLIDRIQDYANGRIDLQDDPEVFGVIANLPIVKDYQRQNAQLKNVVSSMQEALRFLQSSGDSFCAMWENFKEVMKDVQ